MRECAITSNQSASLTLDFKCLVFLTDELETQLQRKLLSILNGSVRNYLHSDGLSCA
ncbi:hypothetical protein EV680_13128 [Uruburuella suis]|jgi:hypothetical protein|uniref:Uncharacterized protein n=1 Tax=Uruburuella suis TaxID=252130 RepID=A0ABY2BXG5_9NEIS|nr:hypothetical protein EV680_13128 [Uruburuella suis]